MNRANVARYRRALDLRRQIAPHILHVGERPPRKGTTERGPQRVVVMTDALDDVLVEALERETTLAIARFKRRRK